MNKKHLKTGAYLVMMIFILIFALLIFSNMEKIFGVFESTSQYSTVSNKIQGLYLYITLALALPFIFLLTLLFVNFINDSITVKATYQENNQDTEKQEKEEEETEENKKEKEKIEKQKKEKYFQEKKSDLKDCLKQEFSKKKLKDSKIISEKILSCISKQYEIVQGEIFLVDKKDKKDVLKLSSTYAFYIPEEKVFEFEIGEGLIGQVAKAKQSLMLNEIPEGYIQASSGLGNATPSCLIIVPMINNTGDLMGVFELATFKNFCEHDQKLLEEIGEFICQFYQQNEK
ncbi:MAG: GAF domain-containing protein [Bacteroidota bacterium]